MTQKHSIVDVNKEGRSLTPKLHHIYHIALYHIYNSYHVTTSYNI